MKKTIAKTILSILMITGIIFAFINFYSVGSKAVTGTTTGRGVWTIDEITGERVCAGQGNECDLPDKSCIS